MDYMLQPQRTEPLQNEAAVEYVEETLGHSMSVLNQFPKYFLIEPINTCNARCVMCGIDFDAEDRKTARISDDLFDKIVDEISAHRHHVEKVMLYLDCEPLIDKYLHLKIKKMKDAGVKRVNIASNASILTEKRAIELIEAGLDEIYISVDSLDPDTFEAIRARLKFDDVYHNTRNFIDIRNRLKPELVIRIQAILQESNYHEAETIQAHWEQYLEPHDQIAIQRAHNWANAVQIMSFGDEEAVNNIPCIAIWGTFCIHVDGTVGLCCMDTTSAIPLGNIKEQTIQEVWQGEALHQVREKHLAGRRNEIAMCNGCTLWRESKRELKRLVGAE
jgi:radical SAM protein with 4Fe4S-binding SPASM domain